MRIGIIGNGFVGQATQLLESDLNKCIVYDINPQKCYPKGTTLKDMNYCKIVFICVPTPPLDHGECNTSIVETCARSLKKYIDINKTYIVCRSTVILGTCDKLDIHHMPEFLTEKNWKDDFLNCKAWIFGSPNKDSRFESTVRTLFSDTSLQGEIYFTNNKTAEMVKYTRNAFLATKVSFCNEIAELCRHLQMDYSHVRELFIKDPRIGGSHTMVPDGDGHRGFGGHCLPKDLTALLAFMKNEGVNSKVLQAVEERNQRDRSD